MNKALRFALLVSIAAMALLPGAAEACSVCFGDPDSNLTKGLNAGVFALLFVVVLVLSGFAAFFVLIAKRSSLTPMPGSAGPQPPVTNPQSAIS